MKMDVMGWKWKKVDESGRKWMKERESGKIWLKMPIPVLRRDFWATELNVLYVANFLQWIGSARVETYCRFWMKVSFQKNACQK